MTMHTSEQTYLSIPQAARAAPGRSSPSAIHRWMRRGVRARSGAWVRLRHARIGRRLYTTAAWIDQWGVDVAAEDAAGYAAEAERRRRPDGRAYADAALADLHTPEADIDQRLSGEGL